MLTATALADAPMADLIDRHRPLMHALVAEVFAVAGAQGITPEPFDAFDPAAYARRRRRRQASGATDALVAWLRTQAKDRSGIWRDIAVRAAPTEVPHHYGPVLAAAARHGVAVPGWGAGRRRSASWRWARRWTRPASRGWPGRCGDRRCTPPTAVDGIDVAGLRDGSPSSAGTLVADLADYAERETPSDDLALLSKGLAHLEEWLDARLGAARKPGAPRCRRRARRHRRPRVRRDAGGRPLTLLATTTPCGRRAPSRSGRFRSTGDRISGPGVFDMKAGLVQAVWALRALRAAGRAAAAACGWC